ncbi:hypothetical protein Q9L42_020940 (plasmid) [Methylomarinum sp. Ch1-1]|uniref:Transmembrane protein n=1 Tax=Methylomarinum roseum TaxID=3067653 RepID=A0AAU7P1Q6_9GAMM
MNKKGNFLSLFWGWLTSSTDRRVKNKHPDLYSLKDTEIAAELQVRSEAARLGKAGLPKPDTNQLTGVEQQIVHRIERARLDYIDWANSRLQVINEDLSRLDVQSIVKSTLQLDQEFSRQASSLLDQLEPQIKELSIVAQQRTSELEDFKRLNSIRRPAHYPTTAKKIFMYSLFLFLIMIEGLANSFFFAQGLDTGLLGGFFMAMMFSALNVVSAGMLGRYLIPFIFHKKSVLRFIGILFVLLAFALMIAIGFGIAHYRDALGVEVLEPAKYAFNSLKSSPFQLQDIMSWGLFGISLTFAVIALFDGLFMSDIYPFYEAKTRRSLEAKSDYETAFNELREELNGVKEEFLRQLSEKVNNINHILVKQNALIQRKDSAAKRLETAIQDADQCMCSLLGIFRQENMIHRSDIPAPKTFNKIPTSKPLNIPDFEIEKDRKNFERQKIAADEVSHRSEEIKAAIQTAFNREFDRLKPLGMHLKKMPQDEVSEDI